MSKMALAAKVGGAKGIRANGVQDIHEIKKEVNLPIIGIIKKDYEGTDIYITPTMSEVDSLIEEGVDIIAMDATSQLRLNNRTIDDFFREVKSKYPHQLFMADCSTVEEAIHDTPLKVKRALELGCYSVVVGSIITRPQVITKRFVDQISK